jgi:hypothetical protein
MPQCRQTGGAMKKIGSLTPTITSPETMAAQCQFQTIFSHGSTIMNSLMIVPNNTFILFAGASGYDFFLEKLNEKLVLLNKFPNIEAYYKNLYDTFFSPEDIAARNTTYPDAHVYTPGDILHNINLTFESHFSQPTVFFYGYHSLPIIDPPTGPGGSLADPHTHRTIYTPFTSYIPLVSTAVARGLVSGDIIRRANVKPEVKKQWEKLIKTPDYETARQELLLLRTANPNVFELSYWFQYPQHLMDNFIHKYEISHPNNKLGRSLPIPRKISLSDFLEYAPNAKIGSTKQYRFIIVTTCRSPDVIIGGLHDPSTSNNFNLYQALPPSQLTLASPTQKLARRMSFSSKQPAEVCPVGVGSAPMNLASVKRAMEDIVPFIKEYSGRELEFLRLIYESFFQIKNTQKVKILKKKGDLLSYDTSVHIGTFLKAIDELSLQFPLLASQDPANIERKIRFQNVIQTFHNMTHAYVSSVITNNLIDPEHTFGEHILGHTLHDKPHLIGPALGYKPNKIDEIRNAFQKKLLPSEEELEAIRPVAEELYGVYNELLEVYRAINQSVDEYNDKYISMMTVFTEQSKRDITQLSETTLKTYDVLIARLNTIRVKLIQIMESIERLTKKYLRISKLPIITLYPTFGESFPRLRTFSIHTVCEKIIKSLDSETLEIEEMKTLVNNNMKVYERKLQAITDKSLKTRRNQPPKKNGVSTTSSPKPNQTRKAKNKRPPKWVTEMRKRQAERNQTARNGNRSGNNGTTNTT